MSEDTDRVNDAMRVYVDTHGIGSAHLKLVQSRLGSSWQAIALRKITVPCGRIQTVVDSWRAGLAPGHLSEHDIAELVRAIEAEIPTEARL